jgi:drug/metabolite transporter (DMT)-like permease
MKGKSLSFPVICALGAVYFFWGTTYLGMKYAIETFPPFFMLSLRFTAAGGLILAWTLSRGKPEISRKSFFGAALAGGVMLLGGTGLVAWAEQFVPSNIAAVLIATMPLWMAILRWGQSRERPSRSVLAGLILGFAGILLLVRSSAASAGTVEGHATGLAVLILAALLWASGSLTSRSSEPSRPPVLATAIQLLSGGLCCLFASLAAGELEKIRIEAFSLRSAAAIAYLAVFGSVLAFSCYTWLLKVTDPALASSYAYVSPVVAVTAGWIFAGESMNTASLLAAGVILTAVALIIRGAAVSSTRDELGPGKVGGTHG